MKFYLSIILVFIVSLCYSQQEVEQYNYLGLNIKYGLGFPGGEMAELFGSHNEAGVGFEYFFAKSKLVISAEANIIFGANVNINEKDVLAPLRIDNGNILGVDGSYAAVFLRERGTYFGMMLEKVISRNPYGRGLRLGLGFGLLTHKVRIQDDSNSVPQVSGDYAKLYDHKTAGPALRERIVYNYVNDSRKIYFSAGFEFTQGFTKNVRALNLDTNSSEDESRLDLMYGLSIKWTLPLRNSRSSETIYY